MEDILGYAVALMPVWIIWIIFHYRAKTRSAGKLDEREAHQLDELNELAERMAERIKTLETILDAEAPDWREHHGEN